MAKRIHQSGRQAKSAGGRQSSKTAKKTKKYLCIGLLERPGGATIADLTKLTGWQAHSVRGFLAGTAAKLPGLKLQSEAADGKPRMYRLTNETQASAARS